MKPPPPPFSNLQLPPLGCLVTCYSVSSLSRCPDVSPRHAAGWGTNLQLFQTHQPTCLEKLARCRERGDRIAGSQVQLKAKEVWGRWVFFSCSPGKHWRASGGGTLPTPCPGKCGMRWQWWWWGIMSKKQQENGKAKVGGTSTKSLVLCVPGTPTVRPALATGSPTQNWP